MYTNAHSNIPVNSEKLKREYLSSNGCMNQQGSMDTLEFTWQQRSTHLCQMNEPWELIKKLKKRDAKDHTSSDTTQGIHPEGEDRYREKQTHGGWVWDRYRCQGGRDGEWLLVYTFGTLKMLDGRNDGRTTLHMQHWLESLQWVSFLVCKNPNTSRQSC